MPTVIHCLGCGRDNSDLSPRCEACGRNLPATSWAGPVPDSREGEALGRFRIQRRLGSGGMGVVYQAIDGDQPVALKLITPELAARSDIQVRFQREARVAGALHHPNIGEVHALEQIGDEWVLVMPLYQGEALSTRLLRGPLTVEQALGIAIPLASALSASHHAGVIHRDVKPANVFLTTAEEVKLLDFGLAKRLERESLALAHTLPSDGAIVG